MNRTVSRGLFFVPAALILVSCGQKKGPVVAKVGGETITVSEFQARLEDTPPAYQPYAQTEQGQKEFLQLLIREKVLLAQARKDGFEREAAYREAVKKFDTQQKERQRQYRETLLVESYLRKLRSKDLAVSDADVQQFYDANKSDFASPQEIQAAHILVPTLTDAETVVGRLKEGEPFEKVAQEASKDPVSAAKGGKLAPFRQGSLVPEFEKAAFALGNGQVSSPVQTQFGFHIIKKLSARTLPARRFIDVKEDIRRRLEREKFDAWVTSKQAALGVEVHEENMK